MTVSTKNALDLIADENYLEAEKQITKLITLYPEEKELYNLYTYCENCIDEICEKEELNLPVREKTPPKKLPIWKKAHDEIQKLADAEEYKKAGTMLGLLWDSPPLEPLNPYLPNKPQPRAILCKERAICHFLQGDMDNAKEQYIHSLDIQLSIHYTDSPERVPLLMKKKAYQEALRILGAGVSIFQRANAYHQGYQIHQLMGNRVAANRALTLALQHMELETDAYCYSYYLYDRYADWLIEKGNLKEALRQNSKAIALWPKFYGYRLKRAEIYARLGDIDNAHAQLELLEKGKCSRLAECKPAEKAKVYECLGDLKTAEAYYSKPTSPAVTRYDNLYDFYTRYGRKSDIATLRKEQRKEPRFQDRVSESELIALI